jgi:hypothetical protein
VIASTLLALVHAGEFALLPPLCLAIALVTSAAHREDLRVILRHAMRSWIVTLGGILIFMVAVSIVVGWTNP